MLKQDQQGRDAECVVLPPGKSADEHSSGSGADTLVHEWGEHADLWDTACTGPADNSEGTL